MRTAQKIGNKKISLIEKKEIERELIDVLERHGLAPLDSSLEIQYNQPIGGSLYGSDGGRNIYCGVEEIHLTNQEYGFMKPLLDRPNEWVSLGEIIDSGEYETDDDEVSHHNTDVVVNRIRAKIKAAANKNGKDVLEYRGGKYKFNTDA